MIYMKRKIKVNDFDVLSPFPFGWLELFLFYISSFFLFLILYKIQLFILCKKNRFLDFIYLSIIGLCGSCCLIIFNFGDKFFIGELFIRSGNKDIIRYSCLFFALYLCISLTFGKKK
ncbi:hypothetical protein K151_302 [Proteus hauseri ZMd44]|nr:hypothetical protein K151_302 [Proteus hauseri ZMd44]